MSSKVEVLGYKNTQNYWVAYPYQMNRFLTEGCAKKLTEMRSIAVSMHLRDHLIITCGYPFWYCYNGFRFHFQE